MTLWPQRIAPSGSDPSSKARSSPRSTSGCADASLPGLSNRIHHPCSRRAWHPRPAGRGAGSPDTSRQPSAQAGRYAHVCRAALPASWQPVNSRPRRSSFRSRAGEERGQASRRHAGVRCSETLGGYADAWPTCTRSLARGMLTLSDRFSRQLLFITARPT